MPLTSRPEVDWELPGAWTSWNRLLPVVAEAWARAEGPGTGPGFPGPGFTAEDHAQFTRLTRVGLLLAGYLSPPGWAVPHGTLVVQVAGRPVPGASGDGRARHTVVQGTWSPLTGAPVTAPGVAALPAAAARTARPDRLVVRCTPVQPGPLSYVPPGSSQGLLGYSGSDFGVTPRATPAVGPARRVPWGPGSRRPRGWARLELLLHPAEVGLALRPTNVQGGGAVGAPRVPLSASQLSELEVARDRALSLSALLGAEDHEPMITLDTADALEAVLDRPQVRAPAVARLLRHPCRETRLRLLELCAPVPALVVPTPVGPGAGRPPSPLPHGR